MNVPLVKTGSEVTISGHDAVIEKIDRDHVIAVLKDGRRFPVKFKAVEQGLGLRIAPARNRRKGKVNNDNDDSSDR